MRYQNHLVDRNQQISLLVRILLEGQSQREMVHLASEDQNRTAESTANSRL